MIKRALLPALICLVGVAVAAYAADNYFPTPGGSSVPGAVDMCLDMNGNAVPISSDQCANSSYNTIAASQTAQALTGGHGGAIGDYLSHCMVMPTSTSPGVVTISDSATAIFPFPGGSSSLSNLAPFPIAVGAKSVNGPWKVTTGANVSVVCVGKFS